MRATPGIDETLLGPQGPGGAPAEGADGARSAASELPAGQATTPGTGAGVGVPAGAMVGEYRVDKEIGRGGMGAVYAAAHPVIGKRVAIKVLAPALSADPSVVKRFIDEARAANKIGHPNIIDIFSFGQLPDGRHYFVMEYLEGETLGGRLERGSLGGAEARRFLVQICEALAAAHAEKIVHRDLNKVLDFGIAKLIEQGESNSTTQTGTVMGTPYYMSPEQCTGRGVDHRTDIYALGVMLYRIFAGRLPFEGESFAEVVAQQLTTPPAPPSRHANVAPGLEALILACLEKDPGRRPQTAAELARRLAEALEGPAGVPTTRLGPEPPSGPVPMPSVETLTPAAAGAPAAKATQAGRAEVAAATSTAPEASGGAPAGSLGGAGTQVGYATAVGRVGSQRRSTALVALLVVGVVIGVVAALVIAGGSKAPQSNAGVGSGDPSRAAASPASVPAPVGASAAPAASAPAALPVEAPSGTPKEAAPTPATAPAPAPAASDRPRGARRGGEPAARPGAPAEPAATPDRGTKPRTRAERQGLVRENPFE
jgi:serine/threonine-protein kinase